MGDEINQNIIFPFYLNERTGNTSFIDGILTKLFLGNAKNKDSNQINERSLACKIINEYTNDIEQILYSKALAPMTEYILEGLSAISDTTSIQGISLKTTFTYLKDTLLNDERPKDDVVDALGELLQTDTTYTAHIGLLKFYGLDPKTIKIYFEKINNLQDNEKLKACFSSIGIFGMRFIIINYLITQFTSKIERERHFDFRIFGEIFALYVTHVTDLPASIESLSTESLMQIMLRTVFHDGIIFREWQFYAERSIRAMSTHGKSHTMRETSKKKKEQPLFHAAQIIFEKLKSPDNNKSLSELADDVRKSAGFEEYNLGKRRIEDEVRKLKKKQKQP
ncbi:hypothetical protein [Solidesulfovibrio magneticus]|uniref:Uncharacterized protein n=1 Tax=Solidesulfovibrio magneticus (strain ATCC 700980 / DSM 13731 / RS-1) TaxID=573370 RepID=C4XJJ1_SOLM1|nr:hypothetical protein [Solidesulfovibrio magneticus]BAH76741.1 hypothetical protein DMR_32500 [Solidesulfovibrio magneticus RS-1]